ncbi:hypothetical protein AB0G60_28375 [Streptomyces angustmyceticus]|uniref:Uncharacterized protein n=1 Tax=Streptomyces angustmyceticus TaxID=285578 RepID=A0A5J4LT90_9ACTN|nr:hypothetical protein [Streptomyces angustmyceticus]UAL69517.1 hypothetical protein K7396_25745 [Streptomyces angustmyceticus]GES34736.1 hypothetical protein San01_72240 [Streptomyces angustmyceticus]
MHPTPVVPERDAWLLPHSSALLRPGETLYGALPVRLDPLVPDRIPRRRRRPKPEAEERERFKGWWRILLPVSFVMWVCALPAGLLERGAHHTWHGFRRLFRGRVWQGGWDSAAGWFVVTTRSGTDDSLGHDNDQLALAFTDQRLLLLSHPVLPEREAARLLGELPRGRFTLRPEPHPARHTHRVDLAFPDGSWLALEAAEREQVPQLTGLLSPVGGGRA